MLADERTNIRNDASKVQLIMLTTLKVWRATVREIEIDGHPSGGSEIERGHRRRDV